MLIPLTGARLKHKMQIKGVIHVGAHYGQEYSEYKNNGVEDVIFIEPCDPAFTHLQRTFQGHTDVKLFHCACGADDVKMDMYVSRQNEGQSNSLLKPHLHLQYHPEILFTETAQVQVYKLDNLPFDRSRYNMLMMDTQGAELLVIKGATMTLPHVDYIYTEVNNQPLYEGCAMIDDLKMYLSDFDMVSVYWVGNKGWGDAIFIRKSLL